MAFISGVIQILRRGLLGVSTICLRCLARFPHSVSARDTGTPSPAWSLESSIHSQHSIKQSLLNFTESQPAQVCWALCQNYNNPPQTSVAAYLTQQEHIRYPATQRSPHQPERYLCCLSAARLSLLRLYLSTV